MSETPGRGRLPAVRRDRRPALAALAVLLIVVGALVSALIAFRSGNRVEVLVAGSDIQVGQVVGPADLRVTRVAADEADTVYPAGARGDLEGVAIARGFIPAGSIINAEMFSTENAIPDGAVEVGVLVDSARRFSGRPVPGDVVRLYFVTGQASQGDTGASVPGQEIVDAARVTQVRTSSSGEDLSVTVLVPQNVGGQLAELSATGSIALGLMPKSTQPDVDWEN